MYKSLAVQRICKILLIGLCLECTALAADVKGRVALSGPNGSPLAKQSDAVVWLTPSPARKPTATLNAESGARARLVQKGKRFDPHMLVVEVGSIVDFPNRDPFFHNVFSLFDGKRFDLGLYEAGSTRSVRFDRPGVCFIFCNIHPEMSAVVIVVDTPYFASTGPHGEFQIAGVPPGRYQLNVWAERCPPSALQSASRPVEIGDQGMVLETIRLQESRTTTVHTNKYGKAYDPQVFSGAIYP